MGGKMYKLLLPALLAGFFFVLCAFAPARFPAGTAVGDIPVGGMTYAQAQRAVAEALRKKAEEKSLTVVVDGQKYRYRYPEIRAKADLAAALSAARGGGAHPLSVQYCLVREEAVLRGICDDFYRRSEDAAMTFDPAAAEPFSFSAERSGRYLDGTVLKKAVEEALGGGQGEVRLSSSRVPARITVAALRDRATLLASFSTAFNAAAEGRARNIALAGRKLNGTVVGAGEEFSFNAAVGERTEANGFCEAPVIFEGDFVAGVGGGVCQASTTVYNAALLAGMCIAEYHPHSLPVGYVEPSFDAMVSGKNADLRFVNGTGAPVYMTCRVARGEICVSLYGKKSAFSYRRESVVTGTLPPPEPRYASAGAALRAPREGLTSCGYLVRYKNGVPVEKKRIRSDRYAPVRGVLPLPHPSDGPVQNSA